MGYIEANVIVDGVLDDTQCFDAEEPGCSETLDSWLRMQKGLAMAHPETYTEIYLLDHEHSLDLEDCSCGQYVTDHHPFWECGE